MNVSVPSSTCGRNASCCALLKRCTSSRNSTVGCAATALCCASATASRMSLMPACTADSAMKRALERSAIRRASVVLPVPGGPHRISECGWPEAIASYSGLPGASRCVWPTNSSIRRGRMRSASGRQSLSPSASASGCCGELRLAMICALRLRLRRTDHVHAGRRLELQLGRIDARVALAVLKVQLHGLAQPVLDHHAQQLVVGKAELGMAEIRLGAARLDADPVQAIV